MTSAASVSSHYTSNYSPRSNMNNNNNNAEVDTSGDRVVYSHYAKHAVADGGATNAQGGQSSNSRTNYDTLLAALAEDTAFSVNDALVAFFMPPGMKHFGIVANTRGWAVPNSDLTLGQTSGHTNGSSGGSGPALSIRESMPWPLGSGRKQKQQEVVQEVVEEDRVIPENVFGTALELITGRSTSMALTRDTSIRRHPIGCSITPYCVRAAVTRHRHLNLHSTIALYEDPLLYNFVDPSTSAYNPVGYGGYGSYGGRSSKRRSFKGDEVLHRSTANYLDDNYKIRKFNFISKRALINDNWTRLMYFPREFAQESQGEFEFMGQRDMFLFGGFDDELDAIQNTTYYGKCWSWNLHVMKSTEDKYMIYYTAKESECEILCKKLEIILGKKKHRFAHEIPKYKYPKPTTSNNGLGFS